MKNQNFIFCLTEFFFVRVKCYCILKFSGNSRKISFSYETLHLLEWTAKDVEEWLSETGFNEESTLFSGINRFLK